MKNNPINIHSQQYMETMARLMSEALESPEGMRALAARMSVSWLLVACSSDVRCCAW